MLYLCTLMRFAEKCARAFVFVAAVVLARTFEKQSSDWGEGFWSVLARTDEKQVRVQTGGRVSGLC